MTIPEIMDRIKTIKDCCIDDSSITTTDVIEAIDDIIHDVEGNDYDMSWNEREDDHYESFENVDFTQLEV